MKEMLMSVFMMTLFLNVSSSTCRASGLYIPPPPPVTAKKKKTTIDGDVEGAKKKTTVDGDVEGEEGE